MQISNVLNELLVTNNFSMTVPYIDYVTALAIYELPLHMNYSMKYGMFKNHVV